MAIPVKGIISNDNGNTYNTVKLYQQAVVRLLVWELQLSFEDSNTGRNYTIWHTQVNQVEWEAIKRVQAKEEALFNDSFRLRD